jgi:hypothetical protein
LIETQAEGALKLGTVEVIALDGDPVKLIGTLVFSLFGTPTMAGVYKRAVMERLT